MTNEQLMSPREWYEDREITDLPEFVKGVSKIRPDSNIKVVRVMWWSDSHELYLSNLDAPTDVKHPLSHYDLLPATECEYLEFMNRKT